MEPSWQAPEFLMRPNRQAPIRLHLFTLSTPALSHPLRSLGQDAAAAAKLSKGTPDSDYWSNPRKAVNPSGPYLYVTTYSRRVGYSMSDT